MGGLSSVLSTPVNWQFLDEPMWKWFIFIGAFALMIFGWNGIMSFI